MSSIWLILGMTVVTYLPRLLPALLMDHLSFPDWFRQWLKNIPHAALAALIFPGILRVVPEHPVVGLLGGGAALLLSLLRLHLVLVMIGAILVSYLVQWLM